MSDGRIVVLGVGNPLMGDDGFGLVALDHLRTDWLLPDRVELLDGGTWGMQLLPVFEEAEEILILDAIESHLPPGTPVELAKDELPRLFRLRVSPHHVDLEDVLALLEFRGTQPPRIHAMGVNPDQVDWGMGLSPAVEAAVPAFVDRVVTYLQSRGVAVSRRPVPCTS